MLVLDQEPSNLGSIGRFRIVRELGRGGMGVVYLGHDPRLDRPVAIKQVRAPDPGLRARLGREARILAGLSHPNVAAIFELEESDDGLSLVMEFIPGETLGEHLARARLTVEESIGICLQVAAAVRAAHEAGVVHRDLKPSNVMLRRDTTVKVLDFGLAKSLPAADAATATRQPKGAAEPLTTDGQVVGTAGYLSPEQARGREVDRRTDVWSFGCLLYECLTGQRAFPGQSFSDTLVAILEREPNLHALPARSPSRLRELLSRCLTKEAGRRPRDIGDLQLDLEDCLSQLKARDSSGGAPGSATESRPAAASGPPHEPTRDPRSEPGRTRSGVLPTQVVRFQVPLEFRPGPSLRLHGRIAFSPDGRHVVFARGSQGGEGLYRRPLAELTPLPLPGTEDADTPCFSPDGKHVAFSIATRGIFYTSADGQGMPVPVLSEKIYDGLRGIAWGEDGRIYFSRVRHARNGIEAVSIHTGEVEDAAIPPEGGRYRWPCVLPGGRLLVTLAPSSQSFAKAKLCCVDMGRGTATTVLHRAFAGRWAPGCPLVFARGDSVCAVAFDPVSARVTGMPVQLGGDFWLDAHSIGLLDLALSPAGHMAHIPGPAAYPDTRVLLFDLDAGTRRELCRLPMFSGFGFSPDGKTLWGHSFSPVPTLTGVDVTTGQVRFMRLGVRAWMTGFAEDPGGSLYATMQDQVSSLLVLVRVPLIDGRASEEIAQLPSGSIPMIAGGRFRGAVLLVGDEAVVHEMPAGGPPRPLFPGTGARLSTDAGLCAYDGVGHEKGTSFVTRFPEPRSRTRLPGEETSVAAFTAGNEVLYWTRGGRLMAVGVGGGSDITLSTPRVLLTADDPSGVGAGTSVAMSPDGRLLAAISDPVVEPRREVAVITLNAFSGIGL